MGGFPNQLVESSTNVGFNCIIGDGLARCYAEFTTISWTTPEGFSTTGHISEGIISITGNGLPRGYVTIENLPGQIAPAIDPICRESQHKLTIPGIGTGVSACRNLS